MIDAKKIEQIARQVQDALPQGIRNLGDDVEKKIRQVLQAQLSRMELVNRDEFDVQTQVLVRTREKLALLEKRLDALEAKTTTDSAPTVVSPEEVSAETPNVPGTTQD